MGTNILEADMYQSGDSRQQPTGHPTKEDKEGKESHNTNCGGRQQD